MLETSKDILNIVIAFCVLWFTIFVCWVIYYLAMILKRIHSVMETFTKTLDAVRHFFENAKDKVNNLTSTINTAIQVGQRVANYVSEKKDARGKKTSRRKAKKEQEEE